MPSGPSKSRRPSTASTITRQAASGWANPTKIRHGDAPDDATIQTPAIALKPNAMPTALDAHRIPNRGKKA